MQQLSPIDAAMIFMETPRTPFHVNMVNVFDPSTCPGDPPTFEDIVEAIRVSLPVAPTFRRRLVRVPMDLDYPYWVEDADFDLAYHMRHIALPSPGDWQQFRTQVARLVARPLDLSRPPWEMTVIEGLDRIEGFPEGCFATVLKVHHAAIDGMAGVELVNAIHQSSPHDRPMKHVDRWRPEPLPSDGQLLRGAWLHSITKPVAIARLVLQNASALAREAFDEIWRDEGEDGDALEVPKTSLIGPISAQRVWDDVGCDLADLKKARKVVAGATINDVCLSILGGALRHYHLERNELPEKPLITMVPISTRTPEQAKDGGNQLSLMRAPLYTDIGDPIERLSAIVSHTKQKKAVQKGVVMPILLGVVDNLPGALLGVAARGVVLAGSRLGELAPCNTMLTNVPGPARPYYMLGAQCVHTTGCAPMMDGGGLLNSVHSYAGRVVFTYTACPSLLEQPDLYRDGLRQSIDELIAAANAREADHGE